MNNVTHINAADDAARDMLCTLVTLTRFKVGGGLEILSQRDGVVTVEGDLNLRHLPVSALPRNLRVTGDLDLRDTGIKRMPRGLRVDGDLYLTSVPTRDDFNNATVGGATFINFP